MARIRRNPRARRGLTPEETFFLRFGLVIAGTAGRPFTEDPDGSPALIEARAAWRANRDELIAAARPYIPWAARTFDGAAGGVSPYDHLRAVH